MDYGVESAFSHPLEKGFRVETAARHFNLPARVLKEYVRQGLLIPLKWSQGEFYFTEKDSVWIDAITQLLDEGHLTYAGIRERLACCSCWQIRHCDFHGKDGCPLISDASKPCWVNRAKYTILCSYPCYGCRVYRSAPTCESFKGLLVSGSTLGKTSV